MNAASRCGRQISSCYPKNALLALWASAFDRPSAWDLGYHARRGREVSSTAQTMDLRLICGIVYGMVTYMIYGLNVDM